MHKNLSKLFAILLVTVFLIGTTLMMSAKAQSWPPSSPSFWVVPETETFTTSNGSVGTLFNVTVIAAAVNGTDSWSVQLGFNASQLQVVGATIISTQTGGLFTGHSTTPLGPLIDNNGTTPGYPGVGSVEASETLLGNDFIPATTGNVLIVTFNVSAAPATGQTLTSLIDPAFGLPAGTGETLFILQSPTTDYPYSEIDYPNTAPCTYTFSGAPAPAKSQVTFAQTGLDGTASGTVVTVNGTALTYTQLPNVTSVNSGDTLVFSYQGSVPSSVSGKQFVTTGVNATSPLKVSTSETITGSYKTQYQVSFAVSPLGTGSTTPSGTNLWENSGPLSISATANSGYVFSNWTTSGSITVSSPSSISTSATVNGTGTITANFVSGKAYSVTFTETGLPPGTSWNATFNSVLNSSTSNTITFTGVQTGSYPWTVSTPIPGTTGIQYITSSTSGTMNVPSQTSQSITYETQYYLTLATSPASVSAPTGAGWYDAGSSASISTDQYVTISSGSSRYSFNGWTTSNMSEITSSSSASTTTLMDEAKTVTANYVTQYNVTFTQTGIGSDFNGTVVNIDGSNYTVNTLPTSFWYDNGSSHSFAFQSPLVGALKKYGWNSTTGLSTLQSASIIITSAGDVTGNYTGPKVTSKYDFLGLGKVDIRDLNLVARAYGSYGPNYFYPGSPASPNWNPIYDVSGPNGVPDGKIDIWDLLAVAEHFGPD